MMIRKSLLSLTSLVLTSVGAPHLFATPGTTGADRLNEQCGNCHGAESSVIPAGFFTISPTPVNNQILPNTVYTFTFDIGATQTAGRNGFNLSIRNGANSADIPGQWLDASSAALTNGVTSTPSCTNGTSVTNINTRNQTASRIIENTPNQTMTYYWRSPDISLLPQTVFVRARAVDGNVAYASTATACTNGLTNGNWKQYNLTLTNPNGVSTAPSLSNSSSPGTTSGGSTTTTSAEAQLGDQFSGGCGVIRSSSASALTLFVMGFLLTASIFAAGLIRRKR